MADLLLTCDMGTTGCKCSAFDAQGNAVAAVRIDYGTEYPRPGWSQQSADGFVNAAFTGIRQLTERVSPELIAGISLSGQMNGCIPVAADGRALHPSIIHSDSRSAPQCAEIERAISPQAFYGLTGNRIDSHFTLPKILWLRDNLPDVYRDARWFLQCKDYVYANLTGEYGVTDYSDASLTIALDIKRGAWAGELLNTLGIDAARMPEIRSAHTLGRLSHEAALATGLIEGTPVAIGGGDGACAARGAGLYGPGQAYAYIGSSAWVAQLTDSAVIDDSARVFNYYDLDGRHNYVCGTMQCGAAAFDWARNMMGLGGGRADIAEIERLAGQVAPGAEGVLFFPELMGSRTPYWDAHNRGCICGFTLYHERKHVARAILEGIAYALYSCGEAMRDNGAQVSSLMLTGGGAQSSLWPDMLASMYNVSAQVHANPEAATSMGAAMAAGVGVGIFPDYAAAAKMVRARSEHAPRPDWVDAYARGYGVYRTLYERLKPINDALAGQVQ